MILRNGMLVCGGLAVCSTLGSATLAQSPAPAKQPQFTTLKADFVPGERAIFFDDFTDMTPGDPPRHFKSRGAAPELRASGDVRQLTAVASGSLLPDLAALPQNFTYEADVKFDVPNGIARVPGALLEGSRGRGVVHVRAFECHGHHRVAEAAEIRGARAY